MESREHFLLKRLAAEWLVVVKGVRKVGFEIPVSINGKQYVVDVVGYKPGGSIAVECGRVNNRKLADLANCFSEVYVIPYNRVLDYVWQVLMRYKKKCENLVKKLDSLMSNKNPQTIECVCPVCARSFFLSSERLADYAASLQFLALKMAPKRSKAMRLLSKSAVRGLEDEFKKAL